jgi:hypothetical protein
LVLGFMPVFFSVSLFRKYKGSGGFSVYIAARLVAAKEGDTKLKEF